MQQHFKILQVISAIRQSYREAVIVYLNGGCYQFFLILKAIFPDAKPFYDGIEGHVVTKIGSRFYDITGEIKKTHAYPLSNEPRIARSAHRWKYSSDR
ncbi:hypothetical protein FHP88_15710 [Sedimenticola selenatireducens]|uniref:Uncharacterized protein n=1 Tax=Sedimenticola selenatireducens TaxID=191960 RepID=A0A557S0I8_9GAMM|nr:hypothetical protein [Sedimenticola selenatireducens]TVO70899.1 hypothetical protein FHP88_15710 [Sedimenticola selenatireducens]